MIKHWHIIISGFKQRRHEKNGMTDLWLRMRKYSSADACVQKYVWKEPWAEVAAEIKRVSHPNAMVNIYAYSWGAGYGFTCLANELRQRSVPVRNAVLCDPVFRRLWLPTWLNLAPSSLMDEQTIAIPDNVAEVRWFYQTQNKPSGHPPVPTSPVTTVHDGVRLRLEHTDMDSSPEFHDACIEAVLLREHGEITHPDMT